MVERKKGIPLHIRIFIGLILGIIAGGIMLELVKAGNVGFLKDQPALKAFAETYVKPAGDIFLNMIFMVVVPMLFAALALGVAELGDARRIGRVGLRSLFMTVLLSGIAVLIGLLAVNLFNPANTVSQARKDELKATYAKAGTKSAPDPVMEKDQAALGIVSKNPLRDAVAAFSGGLLPFMFFALVFGIALASIEADKAMPVINFLQGLFSVTIKMIEFAMYLAPFGVFALMFTSTVTLGYELLGSLATYVLLVLAALAVHQFITYSLALKLIARRSPMQFFRQMRTVMLTAFATSSSNATLPTALKAAEEEVGLPRDVSSFVLTVGATANQNGTALFEGITIVFLAQMFGVDLTLGQQLLVMGLAIVAGIGTAGVPSGSIPMIAGVLALLKVPPEAVGLVLGIDRIMDMSRTVLNVTGDMTIAACVSAMEDRSDAKLAAAAAAG